MRHNPWWSDENPGAPCFGLALKACQVAQRADAGEEEVGAAFYDYEVLETVNACAHRIGLYGEDW